MLAWQAHKVFNDHVTQASVRPLRRRNTIFGGLIARLIPVVESALLLFERQYDGAGLDLTRSALEVHAWLHFVARHKSPYRAIRLASLQQEQKIIKSEHALALLKKKRAPGYLPLVSRLKRKIKTLEKAGIKDIGPTKRIEDMGPGYIALYRYLSAHAHHNLAALLAENFSVSNGKDEYIVGKCVDNVLLARCLEALLLAENFACAEGVRFAPKAEKSSWIQAALDIKTILEALQLRSHS